MNGKTHVAVTLLLTVPVGAAVAGMTRDLGAGAMAAVGCAAGAPISPDLDQDGITISEGMVYDNLGWVFGFVWRFYWLPYALLMPHRHVLSHGPVIGTAIRILYLLIIPGVVAFQPTLEAALALWPAWIGLAISDFAHWVMDSV